LAAKVRRHPPNSNRAVGLVEGMRNRFPAATKQLLWWTIDASALELLLVNDPGPFANNDELVGRNIWNDLGGAICPANAEVGYCFISQPEM
jgi:hypothetical protein